MTAPALSFRQATGLVAAREIRMRLRSVAFLVSTGILLLAVVVSVVVAGFTARNPSAIPVATVGSASSVLDGVDGVEVTEVESLDDAERLVRDGDVDAAVVSDSGPTGVSIIALDSPPTTLTQLLSISPDIRLLDENAQNPLIIYFVALGFGLVFFMSAITFGATIAQSVVEEKQTRVVEILMSAISARALLAGKVVGNSVLALGQTVAIAALASVGLLVSGQNVLLTNIGPSVIWFIAFFALGFVLLAAMFAAAAALVSRQEDVGSTTSPVTMLVMIPYFLVIFFNDNETVLAIMSYVPFSAPVGMPMRIFLGDAQWWEPLVSLAIMLATTVGVVLLGSRIYSNSLLRTGGRVKLLEALRG